MPDQINEINDWELQSIQTRYKGTYGLTLTLEQAKKIYQYERDRDTSSEDHFFSAWEEWDYETSTFKEILTEEQFKAYESWLQKDIRQYEQSLVEEDAETNPSIGYNEELIHFYETHFLPDLFKNFAMIAIASGFSERSKIDYLRTEYKNFLNNTKKQILTNHFRHNRTWMPNLLKASLLEHRLSHVFPDYTSFKQQMDEPTIAVAQYLKTRFRYFLDEIDELLTQKFTELKEFNEVNFKKYHGDVRGWHVVESNPTPEEEKEYRIMTLLLLDKDQYDG